MYRVEVKGGIAKGARAVTESDTVDFAEGACSSIYCAGSGNLDCIMANGDAIVLNGLVAGVWYPISIKRVKVASTAVVVALY